MSEDTATNYKLYSCSDVLLLENANLKDWYESNKDDSDIVLYPHDKLTETVKEIVDEDEDPEMNYCFIVMNRVSTQIRKWSKIFPNVQPYYAIKCFPNKYILSYMSSLGFMCYDCASKGEIEIMRVEHKVPPSHIIFANPVKSEEHLKFALSQNVNYMTVDNVEEISKIVKIYNDKHIAGIVIRLAVDDSYSANPLGAKFGASIPECEEIIKECSRLKYPIKGVSFHVGSGCMNPIAFHEALEDSYKVFKIGENYGYKFELLDLGGGWPGVEQKISLKEISETVNKDLERLFDLDHITVISEPGRYFAEESLLMCFRITLVTVVRNDKDEIESVSYRLSEGIYGAFEDFMISKTELKFEILISDNKDGEKYKSRIFGPTTRKYDIINNEIMLPLLEIGDWLYLAIFGAYSMSVASNVVPHRIIALVDDEF